MAKHISQKPMTEKRLAMLRSQIVLGSLFVRDYENDFGFDASKVCAFFDAYTDYLYELALEDGFDSDFFDLVEEYDNPQNLWSWWLCYDRNPLA